jgi:hypothetical protein
MILLEKKFSYIGPELLRVVPVPKRPKNRLVKDSAIRASRMLQRQVRAFYTLNCAKLI